MLGIVKDHLVFVWEVIWCYSYYNEYEWNHKKAFVGKIYQGHDVIMWCRNWDWLLYSGCRYEAQWARSKINLCTWIIIFLTMCFLFWCEHDDSSLLFIKNPYILGSLTHFRYIFWSKHFNHIIFFFAYV